MKNYILILSLVTILFSCNNKDEAQLQDNMMEVAVADEQVSAMKLMSPATETKDEKTANGNQLEVLSNKPTTSEKKIIKDGSITVKSQDINASKKAFDNLLKQLNAYYESEDLQNNDQTTAYNLKIRIPAANFEKIIAGIENGKDKIESKNIQTRDVTEEYVDTETRLASKRDYLKRYKEILSKASTVKDIMAVEENIRALQEEIESKEGRLQYLKDQVSFSTLNISLYKEKEFTNNYQDGFFTRVKIAVIDGWNSIIDFMLWAIGIWPFLIVAAVSFLAIRKIIKSRKNRKSID